MISSPRLPAFGIAVAAFLAGGVLRGSDAVRPVRLEIEPSRIALVGGGSRAQVAVTAVLSDGSVRDATAESTFAVDEPRVATVTPSGVVRPVADGPSRLLARCGSLSAEADIAVAGSATTGPVSFRRDAAAVLSKAGCNMGACHGNLNGKGGFRLSLRGEDPGFDLASMTRDAAGRRIQRGEPAASLVLAKPTGRVPHEGGVRFSADSPEARALLGWIAGGAADDAAVTPRLTKLRVWPSERYAAAPALGQQLIVTAEFSDGTSRDVTRQASYDVPDPTRVSVSADGRVLASRPCETAVAVRYLDGRAVSRLAFLADRPDFAWAPLPERNAVDTRVFAKLRALKVQASPPADDAAFLRRAHLDAIGVLPTAAEARTFLADADPEKRTKLVDRLVARPEFADFWAWKWADLLRNEEKTMGEKGVWVFQRWLRDWLDADRPLDAFARALVSSTGSTYANPPSSFHRTNRDPMAAAEAVGQVFLGVRLQCARCHNHPFDAWTQDDYYGLAAYFGGVRRKQVYNVRADALDTHEINGDEIIYLSGPASIRQPRSGALLAPKPPGGPRPGPGDGSEALGDLADWLTRDNRQFTRNLANRVWSHLLGRGVVEPVDDFRDSNPPANPALLDALADELAAGGMRLRPLVAYIMKSTTYGLGSRPVPGNADDEANFSHATVRLLPAEVLLDAVGLALGRPAAFAGTPRASRATQLPGAGMGGPFLKVFGKPERLLTCECERTEATTLAQAFQLINGDAIRDVLEAPDNRLGTLLASGAADAAILSELSLACLGREPDEARAASTLAYLAAAKDRRKAWEDVAWAMINSKEFLLRH